MSDFIVHFERIGRDHHVAPLQATSIEGPHHLAAVIHAYANPRLLSQDVSVVVDLDAGTGLIVCGWHNGGRFTVTPAAELMHVPSTPDLRPAVSL